MPPVIVILGAGFAGAYCARGLERRLRPDEAGTIVLDRNNYFVFTPLLVEAGTGSLEPRHTVVPVRDFVREGEFRMAEVVGLDPGTRTVQYRLVGTERVVTLAYDHVVVALGSVTRLPAVEGLRERGIQMKSLGDAVALRDRAIRLLELANATADRDERRRLLHLVVVGGNYTGVEVAGEFDEFMRSAARRYRNIEPGDCRMTLIEREDRILAPLGEDLSAFALRHLERRGVRVLLETTVTEVGDDAVVLTNGQTLATRSVIWCAGIEPSPLNRALGLPLDDQGYIRCDRDLRVVGHRNVWAAGDGAVNPDGEGNAYPATAQHAVRLGAHLARNLAAALRGQETTPCDLSHRGTLAAIGCRTGVARVFGVRLSGFPAWWLWRTVYLLKMPRWSRRVRIAIDWSLNLVFSRDYVQLGVHRR